MLPLAVISLAMPVLLLAGVLGWGSLHGTLRQTEQEAIDQTFAEIVRRFQPIPGRALVQSEVADFRLFLLPPVGYGGRKPGRKAMRYIPGIKRRRAAQVGPVELVRKIGTMDVHEDSDPDAVLDRLRTMTYGSTSSFEVKRRAMRKATKVLAGG